MKTYEPEAGDHISDAAKKAIEKSWDIYYSGYDDVKFEFNGIQIITNASDTVESVCLQYDKKSNKRRAEHEKSDEYKERQNQVEFERQKNQKDMEALMLQLDKCKSDDSILNWIYKAIHLIDNVYVQVDRQIVKDYLINLGYEENWGLNQPKEFYQNKSNFARYIVGQVINCWHPLVTNFIDDYRKMS